MAFDLPKTAFLFQKLLFQMLGGVVARRSDRAYVFQPDDGMVLFTSSSAVTATIPADTFVVNYILSGVQFGSGAVTFTAGEGVTLLAQGGVVATSAQYSVVHVKHVAENVWLLSGVASSGGEGGGSSGIPDLANDPDTTTGLTYGFKAGTARNITIDGSQDDIAAGTVEVADDTVSQAIYMDPVDGFIVKCSPAGEVPNRAFMMAIVDAAGGQITQIQDKRPFVNYMTPRTLADVSSDFITWNNPLTGLDLEVYGAAYGIRTATGAVGVDGIDTVTLTLTDDATNYVEINAAGTISANTSGFTSTSWPIAKVPTSNGNKDIIFDARSFTFLPNGATGTFEAGGDTITVVKGIITDISPT